MLFFHFFNHHVWQFPDRITDSFCSDFPLAGKAEQVVSIYAKMQGKRIRFFIPGRRLFKTKIKHKFPSQ